MTPGLLAILFAGKPVEDSRFDGAFVSIFLGTIFDIAFTEANFQQLDSIITLIRGCGCQNQLMFTI